MLAFIHYLTFCYSGFPLSFDIEIQRLFKDFQGPSHFIFKDQFSTDVYSIVVEQQYLMFIYVTMVQ